MSPAVTIARFTLVEVRRDRLLWLVGGFLVAGFALAEFVGEVAITESVAFQSGFYAALLRGFSVFALSLFVITSMVRELDDKGLELVLSLPIPRSSYFAGKLLGFSALAVVLAVAGAGALLVYAPPDQAALWGASLAMELLIVTTLSILCLFTFSQVTWALSTVLGFYLLARSMAAFQLMAHGPFGGRDTWSQRVIDAMVDGIAYLLPELDRFTRSEWVVYHEGTVADLLPLAGQTAIYVTLLSGAALFDLYRKNL